MKYLFHSQKKEKHRLRKLNKVVEAWSKYLCSHYITFHPFYFSFFDNVMLLSSCIWRDVLVLGMVGGGGGRKEKERMEAYFQCIRRKIKWNSKQLNITSSSIQHNLQHFFIDILSLQRLFTPIPSQRRFIADVSIEIACNILNSKSLLYSLSGNGDFGSIKISAGIT